MEYTIVEKKDNVFVIDVIVHGEPHRCLFVCDESEVDSAVECFANTILNPVTPGESNGSN
jgi:hypothetical protein